MKNIYHLHIPKSGGRYLADATIPFLNYDCQLAGIDPRYSLNTGHNGWSGINEDTYIYTSIRNPIHRTISHYMFYRPYLEVDDIEKTKEQIFESLFRPENEYINNYQSKFISATSLDLQEGVFFEYDFSLLNERLKRINFIVKADDLSNSYATEIYKQSCEWLNITPNQTEIVYKEETQSLFKNGISKQIIDSLTDEEKNIILSVNNKDWEIYNDISTSPIRIGL
jgi:hypothetical protein